MVVIIPDTILRVRSNQIIIRETFYGLNPQHNLSQINIQVIFHHMNYFRDTLSVSFIIIFICERINNHCIRLTSISHNSVLFILNRVTYLDPSFYLITQVFDIIFSQ